MIKMRMYNKRTYISRDSQYFLIALLIGSLVACVGIALSSAYTTKEIQVIEILDFNETWDKDAITTCSRIGETTICTTSYDYDYIISWRIKGDDGKYYNIKKNYDINRNDYINKIKPSNVIDVQVFDCLQVSGFDFGDGITTITHWTKIECNR